MRETSEAVLRISVAILWISAAVLRTSGKTGYIFYDEVTVTFITLKKPYP